MSESKPLAELTAEDLHRIPVWEYEGEDDASAVVHSTDRTFLTDTGDAVYIARTSFTLANGSHFIGFTSPGDPSALECTQPVIISRFGLVRFWFARGASSDQLSAQWQKLGAGELQIFPVHFRCEVPVDGDCVEGVIRRENISTA